MFTSCQILDLMQTDLDLTFLNFFHDDSGIGWTLCSWYAIWKSSCHLCGGIFSASYLWQSRLYRVGISSQNTYSQLVSNLLLSSQSALLLKDRCWNVGKSPNGFWLNVYFLLKQLQKPYVFDFIQQHNLYAAIHDKVLSFTFPLAFTVLLSWRSYCHVLLIGLLAGSFYDCMTPMLAGHCYPWWRGWSHTLWLHS